eukprot:TRINITY_DN11291_c0_g1_i1.p1 TRINITY_DN11291_c0_g1~~TRINITY_DN11291_c0_g1_i1.p1  ORF type:complete len:378 (+),score=86.51 TRINITY_DN11291_c0_g1_i1:8-1141(+)
MITDAFINATTVENASLESINLMKNNDTNEVHQHISSILENEWSQNVQAVANILQNPRVISPHTVMKHIVKGCQSVFIPYYIVSACTGASQHNFVKFSNEDELFTILVNLVSNNLGFIAKRALAALNGLFDETNSDILASFLTHKEDSVRNNALIMLLNIYENKEEEDFVMLLGTKIPQKLKHSYIKSFQDRKQQLEIGFIFRDLIIANTPSLVNFKEYREFKLSTIEIFPALLKEEEELVTAEGLSLFLQQVNPELHADIEYSQELIEKIDILEQGGLDAEQFFISVHDKILSSSVQNVIFDPNFNDDLKEVFNIFDVDGDGVVSVQDLIEAFQIVNGEILTQETAQTYIEGSDKTGSGTLDYEEFKHMMENFLTN